jgi:hypothetical protein
VRPTGSSHVAARLLDRASEKGARPSVAPLIFAAIPI